MAFEDFTGLMIVSSIMTGIVVLVIAINFAKAIIKSHRINIELKKSEKNYRKLFNSAPDTIIVMNLDSAIIKCNVSAESLLGLPIEKIIGQKIYDFILPEFLEQYRNNLESVFNGNTIDGEIKIFRNDGDTIDLWQQLVPLEDEDRGIYGALLYGRDVTEKNRLEEQFHQAQKEESIGRLAGGVAHDLNNLLFPILGYGELLKEQLSHNEIDTDQADEIIHAGRSARDLVNQLLAFSRKQKLNYLPTNLARAIRDFEKLLKRTIQENIKIEFTYREDGQLVMADIRQIEQVIMNLVVNAQDAMADGGIIKIETENIEIDNDSASDIPAGDYVLLRVSDTGCGMDEETAAQVFEPFYSTKGTKGTGLGLATVKGIIKQHKGEIKMISKPDLGTSFEIYLPITEEKLAVESPDYQMTPVNEIDYSILVAEDNIKVRKVLKKILNKLEYKAFVAANGKEALEIINSKKDKIDLLLTDVIMPDINGKELYEAALKIHPGLKVIVMSGYTDNVFTNEILEQTDYTFIQKPVSIAELASAIRRVLKKKIPIEDD